MRGALGMILLGLLVIGAFDATGQVAKQDNLSAIDLYTEVFSRVQELYVREVDPKQLVYASINGMLQSLDSHSSFMDPQSMNEMEMQITGKYGGLGMQIMKGPQGYIQIDGVFDETPAARAGFKAKDIIMKIQGQDTLNMTVSDAANQMRGDPNTQVTIQIYREGWDKPKEFTLTREIIKIDSIRKVEVLDGQIGHIWIRSFQDATTTELAAALEKLEKKPGIRGLILDLRDNPGGPLKEAIDVVDLFIDSGIIVSIKGRSGRDSKDFMAKAPGTHLDYPMVVLVNGGSASASEIVAGAIQDHGRGVIVGTNTFGKGSVQTILRMKDGSGLRLTTALYYTPSGRSIQAKGIEPDIVVEEAQAVNAAAKQPRLREQDLPGHFVNPADSQGSPQTAPSAAPMSPEAEDAVVKKPEATDVQLYRSAEILKSYIIFEGATKKNQQKPAETEKPK